MSEKLVSVVRREKQMPRWEKSVKSSMGECPKCGQETIRDVSDQDGYFVKVCINEICDFLSTGFMPEKKNPRKRERFRHIPHTKTIVVR